LSGAGGGILRDVIRADSRNPALRTSFYAEVCVIWGFALAMTVDWLAR
jgi:polar amino acid transport system substrate-binding protein